jgi:hypothetical protein
MRWKNIAIIEGVCNTPDTMRAMKTIIEGVCNAPRHDENHEV